MPLHSRGTDSAPTHACPLRDQLLDVMNPCHNPEQGCYGAS